MNLFDELSLTCRRLFLRDHEVLVNIGVHDFEKLAPQRILFNVEVFVLLKASTPSNDTLDEVLDYDFIRGIIANRVLQGRIQLQETLCDDLIGQLLKHPQAKAVRLSTQKPDVYSDSAGVGVEVFRLKS